MTSRLATLRSQLASLRRARSTVRATTAWSAFATAVLWALAGVFALDVLFELAVPQRFIVMLLAAGAAGWAFWRFTRPLLGMRESEIDIALLVERQQEIDSDLVAALQFESPEARKWGSPQLETAVIDYVASVGRGINVFEGFSRDQMRRRAGLLAASLVVVLIAAVFAPAYLRAFANRMLLGSMHYPTDTQIERIVINERPVLDLAGKPLKGQRGMRPAGFKGPQGRPLSFCVVASGDLPAEGLVHLQSAGPSHSRTKFTLRKLDEQEARQIWSGFFNDSVGKSGTTIYTGELPRLLENVNYKVFIGDAWTDPALVKVVPLPIVETRLTPQMPKYAQRGKDAFDPSARQVAVLEGTTIRLALESKNEKPLKSAWMTVRSTSAAKAAGGEAATPTSRGKRYDLIKQDAEGLAWALDEKGSPLTNIHDELRYEIQVIDNDGLSLEAPIRGTIRIRPDRAPSGLAEVVHKVVLPTASPIVEYRAADDYGISKLALLIEVERQEARSPPVAEGGGSAVADDGSETSMIPAAEVPAETHRNEILAQSQPVTSERLPLSGQHRLSLASLDLAKGDRVKLTLEVTDYRGENASGQPEGVSYQGDPLVLEISDESGVLAAISEADQRSEERLTDIIKRQLGIGESP
jgi:hypothetical protein